MKDLLYLSRALTAFSVLVLGATAQSPGPDPTQDHLPPMLAPANPDLPTLYIIGDSTVRNGQGDGRNGQWGWGDVVGKYFDASKINVVNWALGGRSSRTYITEGHWDKVVAALKPGDFVIMQFGHNDGGAVNDTSRARGSIRGIGNEAQEIDNLLTKKHEIVHTYGWYLRTYIADTRAKGATPIVCSMIPRKLWNNGKIVRNADDYAGWAREVAKAEGAPFVDLNNIIAERYDSMAPEAVNPLFGDPHTHTTREGAELNAESVVAGLKELKNDPVAPYLSSQSVHASPPSVPASAQPASNEAIARGQKLFVKSCSFCHGTDATGGEGPNLILSSVVRHDKNGDLIGQVIREGRPSQGMPPFPMSQDQIADIVAFLHGRVKESDRRSAGKPSGAYSLKALLTGNAEAGKAFFYGDGQCSRCHSPTGDLAGIAKKYTPIELEPRFLWPSTGVHLTATVETSAGQKMSGELAYEDAFTIAIIDSDGWYHSWPKRGVKVEVKDPLAAHRELLKKYTGADMHNMFAYLETLQ
ncbi:MAG TPA: GDSL-type esterase/lipase family protein [Bryobacteraceae bacterium]|nr:GDSL-type esterase/lipase family protein [Bryobacteraceae bacterium]